jgi:hypothetical protein
VALEEGLPAAHGRVPLAWQDGKGRWHLWLGAYEPVAEEVREGHWRRR